MKLLKRMIGNMALATFATVVLAVMMDSPGAWWQAWRGGYFRVNQGFWEALFQINVLVALATMIVGRLRSEWRRSQGR